MAAELSRKLNRSPLAQQDEPAKLRIVPVLQPVADIERDAIAFAHEAGVIPYSRDARRAFFGSVQQRMRSGTASSAQLATVEVVGAMFDYVVDDRRLPEGAKPLLWRLQQPSVALALLDPGYLSNEPRSLRRLIENFGAIANAYSDEMASGGDLHRRLDTVVRAVEIVASALQTRSAVISQHVDREYGRAVRSVTQLVERVVNERTALESMPVQQNRRDYRRRPDRQREQQVSDRLRAMLDERLAKHDVADSVKDFVRNVWLRHLRTAVLRDGEDSNEFKVALEVVDDLLWSLESGKAGQSRRTLAQKIPPLIRVLTTGLKEIGARDEDHKSFFDELFLVHLRKMRRGGQSTLMTDSDGKPLSDLTALTVMPVLSDEILVDDKAVAPPLPASTSSPAPASTSAPAPSAAMTVPAFVPGSAASPNLLVAAEPPTESGRKKGARVLNPRAPSSARAKAVGKRPVLASNTTLAGPVSKQAGSAPVEQATSTASATKMSAGEPKSPEHRLLEVLNSLEVNDPPSQLARNELPHERVLATINRGDWLSYQSADNARALAKVAWVNVRRTVVLLVRYPDRRALSLRMEELKTRLQEDRAFLVAKK